MTDFSMATSDDGIAIITWDVPNSSMNVLSLSGLSELTHLFAKAFEDDSIKGVVLTSGKAGNFAGGMDLNLLAGVREQMRANPAQGLFDLIMDMHKLMRRIELGNRNEGANRIGKPVACAMPGTGLGIGLELALCTHRIFAADDDNARIGLPEIKVGLFPGAGGTTRLIRKLGINAAAPFLLEGKLVNPTEAKSSGIVDEVVSDPLRSAHDWVLQATTQDIIKPWDSKHYEIPGGSPYSAQGFTTMLAANALVHGRTYGAFSHVKSLLSAIYEGALVDFDTALRIEARWFVSVMMNPTSSAMIRSVFLNKKRLDKGIARPTNVAKSDISRVGVLGAGMMGSGIALVSASAGINVVLLDQDEERAQRGKDYAQKFLDKQAARKKEEMGAQSPILDRIRPTTDVENLADCDLIIEAVFEDPVVKAKITRQVEAIVSDDCIFASNTSTLPITSLAEACQIPERFIGLHFFSPVEKMMLVEIIRGKSTDDQAVAIALDFARKIRKTPIVVNDARFFYTNRCIVPYLNEGLRMAGEGINRALIDRAARMLGFPVGPIQLLDETSLDLAAMIARISQKALGAAYDGGLADEVTFWMVDTGRLGRKSKAGFFDYSAEGKRLGYWGGFNERFPLARLQPQVDDVQQRLLLSQVLEAVRALEENVLCDIREGDVGAILGWGFPAWSGGPFSWLDMVGADWIIQKSKALEQQHGERFACPELLRDMSKSKKTFYSQLAA
ncbi:MAG: 3-hydroxyacyl-CoA dehydrogenase NAD-binding domain-containing protein [Aestuariivita sp.]|nr:3-hydroxyacyl-CoA dehydrogenase NAD-binding domain-containing protein [Aestuariivita sp.]MCY4346969.1 3-hydroxyacyl-CoA dehydrogenase NAD-binding domain-containing protein [Aestuariivita sp.]